MRIQMDNIRHHLPITVWKNPHIWYITIIMVVCSIFYYLDTILELMGWMRPQWGVLYTVHDLHRLLFFIPVVYASYIFRVRGAIVTTLISMLIFLPRAILISPYPEPVLRPIAFVIILGGVGILVSKLLDSITKHKRAEQALRESEEKYRQLIESIHEGIWVIDKDACTTFVNPRMAEMLGYTAEEMLGRHLFSFMDERGVPIATHLLERRKHGIKEQHEFEFLRKDGTRLYAILETSALTDDDGSYAGAIAGVQDITERKKLDKLKDDFISLVSHELRSPLTVITGAVNTVLTEGERLSPEETRQLLKDAALEVESLSNLLGNLLELSRVQANRLVLYAEAISVKKVIQDTVEELKRQSSVHQFIVDIPRKLPPVYADSLRLERILYNLIQNAVKYSPQGGKIRVLAKVKKQHLVIGVSDQGIGISLADQAKLFAPFQRLEESRLDGVRGLGLGLLVCRRLVEAHGGQIWVESEPGCGSTFFFTLPLVPTSY